MLHRAHILHALEMLAVAAAVTAQDDHRASVIVTRAPQPVTVVLADGLGQSVSRTIKINRRRFTPAIRKDGCPRSLFRRKAVVNLGDLLHHLLPSKFIGKPL